MIPLSDIKYLLDLYNIEIKDNIYLQCWNFIINNNNILVPISIADWIIAYNNLEKQHLIPYKYSYQIIFATDDELKYLNLETIDKERIIRILKYMNLLKSDTELFDILPSEILKEIMITLSCSDVITLCKTSRNLKDFCNDNISMILKTILQNKLSLDMTKYKMNTLLFLSNIKYLNRLSGGLNGYNIVTYDGKIIHNNEYLKINNIISVSGGDDNFILLNVNGNVLNYNLEHENIDNIIQISVGYDHQMFLRSNGNVYVKGNSNYGQLGFKNYYIKDITLNPFLKNIIQISTYSNHSLALRSDGKIYAFGSNKYNQLGFNNSNEYVPKIIPDLDDVIQVSAGNGFSLILKSNGTVYGFGNNKYGQLGLGKGNNTINYPTLIPELNNIKQISAGNFHSLALNNDGNIYVFGYFKKQLGENQGEIYRPVINSNFNNVIEVFSGNEYSLILTKDEKVFLYGKNGIEMI